VYLNTPVDQYPKQRAAKFGGSSYRTVAKTILAKAGVRPTIEVLSAGGRPVTQAQIARYVFSNSEILTIVKENVAVAGIVGQDGVTIYNDSSLGQVARQDLTIKLPRKFYVADVRSGKQLGYTDFIQTSTLIGDALVFGLSTGPNTVKISGPTIATRGEHVPFAITSVKPERALVRCHVFAPNGTQLAIYSTNVLLENGKSTFVLPFALNDAPGKYTLRITDIVTGAASEHTIMLKSN
jgi:hypothetical protein